MTRLTLDGKYWTAVLDGTTLRTQFGKVGSPGQTRLKPFATAAAANAALAEAVADKRGEGYATTKADPTVAKPAKAPKPSAKTEPAAKPSAKAVKRRAALVALATQLGEPAAATEVALACDAPEAYAKKYRARLEDREIDTDGEIAWIALVDALEAKRRLAALDWKQDCLDTLRWIAGLAKPAGKRALAPLLADKAAHDAFTTYEILELAAAALAPTGEALLQLDTLSDSYEMVVVPTAAISALLALGRAAGETIVQFKGKSRDALAKARVKETAREAVARANPWGELLEDSTFKNRYDVLGRIPWGYGGEGGDTALAKIRAALPYVPAADRPFVELAVALNGKQALATARDTKDARLALDAAQFMMMNTAAQIATRLRAVAILVRRLKLLPNPGKHHELAATALFGDDSPLIPAVLAALSVEDRDLLARLADALVRTAPKGSERMSQALNAAKTVGDTTTLALLEAGGRRTTTGDRGEAMVAIRARLP